MKKAVPAVLAAALALPGLGATACTDAPLEPDSALLPAEEPALSMAGGGVVASVTGSGHSQSARRTYNIDVRKSADGTVTGWIHVRRMGAGGTHVRAAIDCLHVNGNQAWAGGIIVVAVAPGNIGLPYSFRVVDNGEGANAPPDEIRTEWAYLDCNTEWTSPTRALTIGNLQVRD